MPRRVRDHSPLASDIVRSWASIGIGVVVAVVVAVVMTSAAGVIDDVLRTAFYASWTVACVVYIVLSVAAFAGRDAATLRRQLVASGPGESRLARFNWSMNGGGGLWWSLTGAAATFATLVELSLSRTAITPLGMVLAVVVAIASLALIVVAFAVNYAREDAQRGGLEFPGDEAARFGDYVYLAAQVSTTFGGSDVATTRSRMRRVLAAHGMVAFAFNTVIVALLVSVLVSGIH